MTQQQQQQRKRAKARRAAAEKENFAPALTPAQFENRKIKNQQRRMRRQINQKNRSSMLRAAGMPGVYPLPGSADTGMRRFNRVRLSPGDSITKEGLSFLKCAFAPPDFATSDVAGVPDDFRGRSLVKKHRLVSSLSIGANTDTYLLLLPTPGIAFWQTNSASNVLVPAASAFNGTNYSDFGTMFGTSATTADMVTKFRYVSNHIELIPTVNQMNWSGNIQCWKMPVTLMERQTLVGAVDVEALTVSGLNGVNAVNGDQYTGPVNLGVYSACYNTGAKFDFQPIMENRVEVPATQVVGVDFGQLSPPVAFTGLHGQFEALVIKIAGAGVNPNNTFIVKTWACVEYQVNPGNLIYEFASISPCDELALRLYREVILNLPVGVSFVDNETFWMRVLGIIRMLTGAGAAIPGPIGAISGGVSSIAGAIQSYL